MNCARDLRIYSASELSLNDFGGQALSAVTFTPVTLAHGVDIHDGALTPAAERILSPEAIALVARLHRALAAGRDGLLADRARRQAEWDAGAAPGYLPAGALPEARGEWRVADLPADMRRRRVEITGPASDARMVINMLSRGADGARADAAMIDFEDAMKPSWANVVAGVENIIAAAEGSLEAVRFGPSGEIEKRYRLDPDDMPLMMVRVRGLHLDEANLRVDGEPVSAGLFDLVMVACHAARALVARGKTPAFYVPKVEHHLEARWWDRLFSLLESEVQLELGTLRATFLIETLPAAFQVEEILYELRAHAAALNVGRWDKIFSDIKCLRAHPDRVLADRASIGLNRSWMLAYARQLIQVCHAHGALAIGGMAAFTPGRDADLRQQQTARVVTDKELEASMGHDGCWVSHPYFIGPAMEPFARTLAGRDNQLDVIPDAPARPDLLPESSGPRTLDGLRTNVRVGIAYLRGWNDDLGCVAWDNLMEDLATLEISRVQVGQWLRHGVVLDDGARVDRPLVARVFDEELARILDEVPADEHDAYRRAARDARSVFLEDDTRPFLTTISELATALAPSVPA